MITIHVADLQVGDVMVGPLNKGTVTHVDRMNGATAWRVDGGEWREAHDGWTVRIKSTA